MSGAPGRRAPEQRRAAVLEAAQQLFLADGVPETPVEAIARRAGVAKGTVYLYFPSKEHLVRALERAFEERLAERTRAAAGAVPAAASAGEAAGEWCAELVGAYLDELAVHDLLFRGRVLTREEATDNALLGELTALLGERGAVQPADAAAFLVGGVTGLVDGAVRAGSPDAAALARTARSLALGALGQRPGP